MASDLKALIGRLNPVTKRALEQAAQLCVSRTHYNVEIEHFLKKLLDAEGTDLQVALRYYEVDTAQLDRELDRAMETFKRGSSRTPAFSPQLVELLEEALVVANLSLGSGAIRSGAVLRALLENKSLRGTLVDSCPELVKSLSIERLAEDLPELVTHSDEHLATEAVGGGTAQVAAEPAEPGAPPGVPRRAGPPSQTPALDQYTIDLTGEARAGKIDPIRGREPEIRQVIDVLTRRRQNNPILVGDAGVGKTAIVEGFARRIAAGEVPPSLADVSLRILDLGLLQAGAGIKGEFEERLKNVIAEVKGSARPIILFVDEAHTLIGAGAAAGSSDAANLLKPALARGELRTIAATTWPEYKKYIEKDPALTRRFQLIRVDEPDEEAAIDMLRAVAANLETHHGVRVLDEGVRDAVTLSARYLSERRLPDKAISVLDTACARVALALEDKPPRLEDIDRRIQLLELELASLEREEAAGADHGAEIGRVTKELEELRPERAEVGAAWEAELELVRGIREIEAELDEARAGEGDEKAVEAIAGRLKKAIRKWEKAAGEEPLVPVRVDGAVVASVISGWTGIPVGGMVKDEIEGVLALQERMAKRVVGQNQALEAICKRIATSRAGLEDPGKPKGVFLLVGPSGVGKTETALTLAEVLFGGEKNLVTLNMSEFQEGHSVATLKGSPPGYVGYGEGGVLTEAVRRRPYSVVLLDEAEKAHTDVMELFYQVFDKGVLEDAEGVVVDFKNTIILLATNLAADAILRTCDGGERPVPETLVETIRPELLDHFRPALLGRLAVIPYYPLGGDEIRSIVRLKLGRIQERIRASHMAELSFGDDVIEEIAARCTDPDTGARTIDYILNQTLLPEIAAELLERMAAGETFSRVSLGIDDPGGFAYEVLS